MIQNIFTPHAFFTNFIKVIVIFDQNGNRGLPAKEIADKLHVSHNYIFQTTKAMKKLTLLEDHIGKYSLSTNGKLFSEYIQKGDEDGIKRLGEKIIYESKDEELSFLRKAISKLREEPNITDYVLGVQLADEFNLTWSSTGTYQRVGNSCRSISEGFNLIGDGQKEKQLELKYDVIYNKNSVDIIAHIHKDVNTYIHLVMEDENAWKNHIELKQRIEKSFDELIKNQYAIATQLLLQEGKKWFKEGVNRKDIDLIRLSLVPLMKIEFHNLLK